MATVTEKSLERYGARKASERGIYTVKLAIIRGQGWPDHTLFKKGKVGFIEYKADENSKFQKLQKYYLDLLDKLGFQVAVCWSREQVDAFLEEFDK